MITGLAGAQPMRSSVTFMLSHIKKHSSALWFFGRVIVFFAVWAAFLIGSTKYYFNAISDVGAPFWSMGLLFATPILFLIWIAIDRLFMRKSDSLKKLWAILFITLIIFIALSPVWFVGGLILTAWVKTIFY